MHPRGTEFLSSCPSLWQDVYHVLSAVHISYSNNPLVRHSTEKGADRVKGFWEGTKTRLLRGGIWNSYWVETSSISTSRSATQHRVRKMEVLPVRPLIPVPGYRDCQADLDRKAYRVPGYRYPGTRVGTRGTGVLPGHMPSEVD
eukprot:953998-Rhodomonas_salina.1